MSIDYRHDDINYNACECVYVQCVQCGYIYIQWCIQVAFLSRPLISRYMHLHAVCFLMLVMYGIKSNLPIISLAKTTIYQYM